MAVPHARGRGHGSIAGVVATHSAKPGRSSKSTSDMRTPETHRKSRLSSRGPKRTGQAPQPLVAMAASPSPHQTIASPR